MRTHALEFSLFYNVKSLSAHTTEAKYRFSVIV